MLILDLPIFILYRLSSYVSAPVNFKFLSLPLSCNCALPALPLKSPHVLHFDLTFETTNLLKIKMVEFIKAEDLFRFQMMAPIFLLPFYWTLRVSNYAI